MRLSKLAVFKLLGENGMSKQDLSLKSGISYNGIRAAVSGQVNCKPSTVRSIAEALGVPIEKIIEE